MLTSYVRQSTHVGSLHSPPTLQGIPPWWRWRCAKVQRQDTARHGEARHAAHAIGLRMSN